MTDRGNSPLFGVVARRTLTASAAVLTTALAMAACSSNSSSSDDPTGGTSAGGTSAGGSSTGKGGSSTGKGGTSAGGTSTGKGGAAGTGFVGGVGGMNPGAGGAMAAGGAGGSSAAGGQGQGGTTMPDVMGDGQCVNDTPDAMPTAKICRPATDNECDGQAPSWEKPGDMVGGPGNGFDDDCDGQVDEGCACDNVGLGATKDCWEMPSSLTTGKPDFKVQGWCDPNSKGKEVCINVGAPETPILRWSGTCMGAQKPFDQDICAPGDFNCDGVPSNPPMGCKCANEVPVICPDPIYTKPFPDPAKVGQFTKDPKGTVLDVDGIDGKTWINPKAKVDPASVTNWRWTVTGGPCDDTLPHPTFGLFPTAAADWKAHLGTQNNALPTKPDSGQPDPSKPAGNHKGYVVPMAAGVPSKVYPAFSLSGDYYVTGKFTYTDPATMKTTEGQCTQQVKVRAPGLRVELCWPEVGPSQDDNDVDLHVARLQGGAGSPHGWFTTAGIAPNADDCYYSPNSGCSNRVLAGQDPATWSPKWYANEVTAEPGNVGVCHGWGSRRSDGKTAGLPARPCTSPRLDRDNIDCSPAIDDPNAAEADPLQQGDNNANFCGPENINVDGQVLKAGEKFAIGVQCYNCVSGVNGAANAQPAHPRVNIYCDGELKLFFGYDPAKPISDPTQEPQLWTEGKTFAGALWDVGVVTWNGDPANPCDIKSTTSKAANSGAWHQKATGGGNLACVQNGPSDSGAENFNPPLPSTISWPFNKNGTYPTGSADLCPY
jgi:hypothetical protein